MSNRECAVGCGRSADAGKLMCRRCWAQVPFFLQDSVYRTWRAYSRAPVGMSAEANTARRKRRLAYQAARDAAIASVR